MKPGITKFGALDMQVCVPKEWTDKQVIEFANDNNPARTTGGWCVVKEGSIYLAGDPERVTCKEHPRNVHIMLEC